MLQHLVLLLAALLLAAQPALAGATYGTPFPTAIGGTGVAATHGFSQAFPHTRPPAATDDAAHGYVAGDLWFYDGRIWQAQAVAANAAVWQTQTVPAAATCDLLSTACKAAYGVYKLKAAYAGNAFSVTRASDSTTQAVGFDAAGVARWADVDGFCVATTCTVNTWYDQSGNGYDLTQATAANQPTISGVQVGTQRGITMYGSAVSLTNTSLPVTNVQTVSVLATVLSAGGNGANGNALFELDNTSRKLTFKNETNSSYKLTLVDSAFGSFAFNSGIKSQQPLSLLLVTNGSSLAVTQNNQTLTATGPVTSSAATGIQVGKSTLAYAGNTYTSLVVWDAALSAADQKTAILSANVSNGIQPQDKASVILVGDSLTCCTYVGGNFATDSTFPGQLARLIGRPVNVLNYGTAGATIASMATAASVVAAMAIPSGAPKVFVVFGGTNDLAAGTQTPSQIYANQQSMCATFRAAGGRCVVASLLPRNGLFTNGVTNTSYETNRQTLETSMVGGWAAFADGFVDLTADPVIGPSAAANNAAYFNSTDKTHLTAAGNAYVAAAMARTIIPLLQ